MMLYCDITLLLIYRQLVSTFLLSVGRTPQDPETIERNHYKLILAINNYYRLHRKYVWRVRIFKNLIQE